MLGAGRLLAAWTERLSALVAGANKKESNFAVAKHSDPQNDYANIFVVGQQNTDLYSGEELSQ